MTYLFRQRSSRIRTITSNFPSYSVWSSFKNNTAKNIQRCIFSETGEEPRQIDKDQKQRREKYEGEMR